MKIKELFNKPKIIGILGNVNEAKSNMVYYLIEELEKEFNFNLVHFGLKADIVGKRINSIKELEQIRDSIIFLDELGTLFDFDDRRKKRLIEQTLRMISHNNNILVLISVPETFKKFISAKLDIIIYKKCFYQDFINGSKVKSVIMDFTDTENIKGSSLLNIDKDKALVYNGDYYNLINVPYLPKYDTKKKNCSILCSKKGSKNVVKK